MELYAPATETVEVARTSRTDMDKIAAAETSKAGKEVNAKVGEHGCGRMSRLYKCRATT